MKRFSFTLAGVTSLGVMALVACSPEERAFDTSTSGTGGAAGGGGSGGGIVCTPDEQRSCYSGPPGTEDVGTCKPGIQVCLPNGTGFGECGGEVLPQPEDCLTTEDEACNGADALECPPLGNGWLKTYGESLSMQLISDVAIAPDGNIVIVGGFGGTIDLGGGPLASTGSLDILLAKLTPKGEVVWAKRFGDSALQQANAIAIDKSGAIYVGGRVLGAVDFGGGVLTSKGSDDAFVAKFDANGDHVWSKLFGDTASQEVTSIAVTNANQVVVAGNFASTINFGGTEFTSVGVDDMFLAKFDETGFHAGSRRMGGQGADDLRAIAVTDTDHIVITGNFASGLELIAGTPFTSKGGFDVFAAQFNPSLNAIWARGWGDPMAQQAFDVAIASNGDVFLTGTFEGALDVFGQQLQTAADGARALYVTRIASTGDSVVWAKAIGDATSFVEQANIAVGTADQLALAGTFRGGMDFGGGPLMAMDAGDVFFAKLGGADGAHVSSRVLLSGGSKDNDAPNSVLALALLPTGDLIVGGQHHAPFLIEKALVGAFDGKSGDAFLGRFLP
ncbi:hypothetical protein [Polyangium jinanense]|uniref:Uncharacterized protein n=1 Tax=Polyangium jinanense TaxID=2829994 RepID=A0A9X4ASK4_9BACT|nr:hypothetical protein [Polyangium jinanense]MDC3979943.1 hypothetical protein [Polyangium jinanense]MDC3982596.1 hypothetical protein [Polyangium jinanense]